MTDFCQIILYASMTFTHTNISVEDKHFTFRRDNFGYSVTGEFGARDFTTERDMITWFKKRYCKEDYILTDPVVVME